MENTIRSSIKIFKVKFREHFNKNKKQKISFRNKKEALKYIKLHNLKNYSIYKCHYCNHYHISKINKI